MTWDEGCAGADAELISKIGAGIAVSIKDDDVAAFAMQVLTDDCDSAHQESGRVGASVG